jgi:uncharacterized protein with HEPN domain
MRKREYLDYIQDIIDAIKDVEDFVKGMNLDDFMNDRKTILAVIKSIENIGEAAKGVPHSIRNKYVDIPWKDMAGMRDKLSHVYFGVDLKVVWKTIQQDLPRLKIFISRIIAELKDEE